MSNEHGPVPAAALEHQLRANGEEAIADLIAQTGDIFQGVVSGDMSEVVLYSPDQLDALHKAMNQVQAAAE